MSFALLWFFKSVGVSNRGMSDNPLATIIYTNYALDIDVDRMEREAWGHSLSRDIELPIRYGEIHSHFPELSSFGSLSTAARKVFLSVIPAAGLHSGLIRFHADYYSPCYESEDSDFAEGLTMLRLPPYQQHVETFGSWLGAIKAAGLLQENGTLATVRGTRCIADDGHACHSLSKKTIDDWQSRHDVPHDREPFYPYHRQRNPAKRLRADWSVRNTFIEFAGMMDSPDYFGED